MIVEVFSALANEDRLAIISYLHARPRPASIGEIARELELTRFATSRHLGILRSAGVVAVTRSSQRLLHSLSPSGFEAVEDWLVDHVLFEEARSMGGDSPDATLPEPIRASSSSSSRDSPGGSPGS